MIHPTGYSLWFMPSGDIYQQSQKLIDSLSSRNSCLTFEPHVTLLGTWEGSQTEAIDKTKSLAKDLKPVFLRFNEVGYLDEFYRCLFWRAEQTSELREAYEKAQAVFGRKAYPPYMPHLSLLYGAVVEAEKQSIVQEPKLKEIDLSFRADSIHLFATEGPSSQWKRVGEYQFSSEK